MEFYDRLKLTLIAFVLSFSCNFQYGFSSTYMNAPVDEFRNFINESLRHRGYVLDEYTYGWMWNLIANVWFVGFFFGIWLNPVINDKFGRKIGFISMNAVSALASVLRFVAVLWMWPEALFVGRLLASVATAVTYQSLILFLQECSPTDLRGFFSFTSEISYALCSLLGVFLGMESILGHNLKLLIGSAIIPSLVALVVLFPMHETPKFLYIVKGDGKQALKSIRFYHGANADVDAVFREIEREAEEDSQSSSSLREILYTPYLRKAVFLSCLALQNTVALWAILLSSTDFLRHANLGSDIAEWSSTGMAFCYALGTILGLPCVERFGRRCMTLTFGTANTVCLLVYVLFAAFQPQFPWLQYGCLTCFLLYGFTYGFGVGPISWFLSAELVPQRHRSLVQSTCYAINTVMVVISTFAILPLFWAVGAYAFLLLYVGPSIVALVILYFQLPETKGREIHDIVKELRGMSERSVQRPDTY